MPTLSRPAYGTVREAVAAEAVRLLESWQARLTRACGDDPHDLVSAAVDVAVSDLAALAERDPAAHNDWRTVLESYRCFRAVMSYRLAHAVLAASLPRPETDARDLRIIARHITEQAKVETGVEIHPGARIGARFVVDHGMGTVIGETATIGADCYLLQGVVLGAVGIAHNRNGKRHPTLGDRVEVGAFARILGPVTVGDDVLVGTHVLVREDVPDRARVSVLHQYQVVVGDQDVVISGVECVGGDRYRVHGRGLRTPGLCVESRGRPVPVIEGADDHLLVDLPSDAAARGASIDIRTGDGAITKILIPRLRLGGNMGGNMVGGVYQRGKP